MRPTSRTLVPVLVLLLAGQPAGLAWLLDGADPVLKALIPAVVFYAGFDDGSGDADLATGTGRAKAEGKPEFLPGVSGKAFHGGTFRYAVQDNLRVDRPGALSFWLCAYQWPRGDNEPLLHFFMTEYKNTGFLGVERQGQIVKDGRQARTPGLLIWFHYFKDIPNLSPMTACNWPEGEWHFLVLTWRGPRWELSVDGTVALRADLARPLRQDELSREFLVAGDGLIDEFTIYRRPLTEAEILAIHAAGRDALAQPKAGRP